MSTIIKGSGRTICKATAGYAYMANWDTRVMGVDFTVVAGLFQMIGRTTSPGAGEVVF